MRARLGGGDVKKRKGGREEGFCDAEGGSDGEVVLIGMALACPTALSEIQWEES